jgi:hypothetical protein
MAATPAPGIFSMTESYSLEQLTVMCGRPREWVRNTFIRPVDHRTKKRLINKETGEPIRGVFHFRLGSMYIIPGQALIAWLMENGGYYEDDSNNEDD